MTHPILYLFLHSSTRFTLCSLFTFSLLFYYNYFDQRLFFLPFLPSFHFKLDLESTDDHFYKDIFSSFPIIHRGKRVISYFSQNDMTFSIVISLHLRLLHISHTVFLNQFTYLFFFFFHRSISPCCCRKFISILASVSPVMCNVSGRVGVGVGVGTSVSVSLSASALSYRWLVSRRTKAVEYVGTRRDH